MRLALLIALITSINISHPSSTPFTPSVNIRNVLGRNSSEAFGYKGGSFAYDEQKIHFEDGDGYFIRYKKDNNSILGSILFRPFEDTYKVELIYPSSYYPTKNGNIYFSYEDRCFHNNIWFEQNNIEVKVKNKYRLSNESNLSFVDSDFFDLKNSSGSVSYLQNMYSSSYLSEVKIKNVPNYRNTQFNHYGCTPTSAAMYYAYLEDRGFNIIPSAYSNLPIKHTDNKRAVNNFIKYLGTNYFKTTNSGTLVSNIPDGYNKYLSDMGFSQFSVKISSDFNYYCQVILQTANPVPVDIAGHSRIGIGYRFLSSSSGTSNAMVIVNQVLNDDRVEAYIPAENIVRYYFISK